MTVICPRWTATIKVRGTVVETVFQVETNGNNYDGDRHVPCRPHQRLCHGLRGSEAHNRARQNDPGAVTADPVEATMHPGGLDGFSRRKGMP